MVENKDILMEIENDSKALLEELSLLNEENTVNQKNMQDKSANSNKELLKKKIVNKGNAIIKNMQRKVSDEEYIIKGFHYHSKVLYSMSVKYPFLSKTIGVPLMALTKAVTNNAIHKKMEREKILNVYTGQKGDKAAVDAKIARLEKLQKLDKEQKEELVMLKKMSAELEFNIKRLEYNFKLSHMEEENSNTKQRKHYTY